MLEYRPCDIIWVTGQVKGIKKSFIMGLGMNEKLVEIIGKSCLNVEVIVLFHSAR